MCFFWNYEAHAVREQCEEGEKQCFRTFSWQTNWEYQFARSFCPKKIEWIMLAQDRQEWGRSEDDHIEWRLGESGSHALL